MLSVAVVIPSYKVKKHILDVIKKMGREVKYIYVVDDKCPEKSGKFVQKNCNDKRVRVLFHSENKGVGGAVITGYREASQKADIVVKVDGDGQMDPKLIPTLIKPIAEGKADYSKGNRFFRSSYLRGMPFFRLIGNAGLSLINKFVTGYWNIMDPANGFTAIHSKIVPHLFLNKVDNRYFFESDLLYRLSIIKAVVADIPMIAKYENEKSNMNIGKIAIEFFFKYFNRFIKRILYNYFLRDFNIASLNLILGTTSVISGLLFGSYQWHYFSSKSLFTPTGTIMIAALFIILGFQMLLFTLAYDVQNIPRDCLHKRL